jgi:hypothetical protein
MLWIISSILMLLWVLGLATSFTLGGFIHMLLITAVAVLVIQVMELRRAT